MKKTSQKARGRHTDRHAQTNTPQESGAIYKDWGGRMRVALSMPTTYFVGMSSLALQLLYRMFNAESDVVCERIFWEKGGAQAGKPLESIEGGRTPDEFDLWAFTISWEMDYFSVIEMLRQAGIPPLRRRPPGITPVGRPALAAVDRRRPWGDDESRADGADL